MEPDKELWRRVGSLFYEDDQMLHHIHLSNLSARSIPRLTAHLQNIAARISPINAWDRISNVAIEMDDLAEGAKRVVLEELDPVHALLSGMVVNRAKLPDIGLLIFADELTLDYRKGKEWSPKVVTAFFELIRQLKGVEPNLKVRLDECVLPQWHRRLHSAFEWYCDQ
jgi:hypothetical protein